MLKLIYAQTAPGGSYPSYVNFSGIVGSVDDGIRIIVRDAAHLVEHENGSHLDAGHVSTTIISKEQALDLADAIKEHYGEEAAQIATDRISNGLVLGQAEVAGTEVEMPVGTVEAAQPDGRNAPSPRSAPLAIDVVAEPPHLRDSEFVPAGGADPGDESVKA